MTKDICMIFGAATGIGAAAAKLFSKEGLRVVVCDINERLGRQIADEVEGAFFRCDVSNFESVKTAIDDCIKQIGVPQYAYVNSGVVTTPADQDPVPLENISLEDYRHVMSVNLDGVFHCIKVLLPIMRTNGGGAITISASAAALLPTPMDVPYAASKAAAIHLVRSLAAQDPTSTVRVSAVCPGIVDTTLLVKAIRETNPVMMPPIAIAREALSLLLTGRHGDIRAKFHEDQASIIIGSFDHDLKLVGHGI
ncbi:MAG: NAD(P)-dependent dehydrogenase (short-subunit alcohol dehydrogenase family) [Granulosicoccus sp.]|jgi:NAD(P)-dependent dehydrogenase (short-subunit alcohol dehydrogenase family)